MKTFYIFTSLFFISSIGCKAGPEPSKFCDSMLELAGRDAPTLPSTEKQTELKEDCVKQAAEMRAQHPSAYSCRVECLGGAKNIDALQSCANNCKQ